MPFTFLLYADKLQTPENARNQATRISKVMSEFVTGFNIKELIWAIQSDNTGKAANVAGLLGIMGLRCVCHLLALGPAHLLHPHKTQHNHIVTMGMHQDGVRECYELCEKVRRLIKFLYPREDERVKLQHEAKFLGVTYRVFTLDSTCEWKSTVNMLDGICRGESLLTQYFIVHSHRLSQDIILVEDDYQLARELIAVHGTINVTSMTLEANAFKGSSVLPLLHIAKVDLASNEPIDVPMRGDRHYPKTQPIPVAQLKPCVQEYRGKLVQEIIKAERHLSESHQVLEMASALDPRWRSLFFLTTQAEKEGVKERLIKEAMEAIIAPDPGATAQAKAHPDSRQDAKRPKKEHLCPNYNRLQDRVRAMQHGSSQSRPARVDEDTRVEVTKAVEEWLALPCEELDTDPLTMWKDMVEATQVKPFARYLGPLALKYLVAPGANGTVERLWSDGRRVLTYGRHALSGTRFDQILGLKCNLRALGLWPPKAINV